MSFPLFLNLTVFGKKMYFIVAIAMRYRRVQQKEQQVRYFDRFHLYEVNSVSYSYLTVFSTTQLQNATIPTSVDTCRYVIHVASSVTFIYKAPAAFIQRNLQFQQIAAFFKKEPLSLSCFVRLLVTQ